MTFDAADLAALVDPDMPGYALATIGGNGVAGLFSNDYRDAFGMVSSNMPNFMAPPAVLAAVARGATVVVNATNYTVAKIETSTHRLTRLMLEAA